MAILESLFVTIGRWFGFVGACVAGPGATCLPFLVFVLLAAAAAGALFLLFRAYRIMQRPEGFDPELERKRLREFRMEQRVRRSLNEKVAPRPVSHRGWRMPA